MQIEISLRSFIYFGLILLAAGLGIFLSACASSPGIQAAGYIELNNLEPLPTPEEAEVIPLRVAIAAVISPRGSAESYAPLLNYLSAEIGRPVVPVQRRTYSEINDLIRTGEVDLAFVCTSSYLAGRRDFGMQLLAAPQVHGEKVYRAQIIVPTNSRATNLMDLRGTVFAFTDPMSFTGRLYPTHLLQLEGETPEEFFEKTIFTYSHDDAIRAVTDGLVDGASIDALVLDFALKRDPDLINKLRVIHTSAPFGIPPVVVGPDIRPQLEAELSDILLHMHENSSGLTALQALDYDRFVPIEDAAYNSAEEIETSVLLTISPEP